MKDKLIIGIIPSMRPEHKEDPYQDQYIFVDMYIHKVYEGGAIPLALVMDKRHPIVNTLEMCDAFIWPGGGYIDKHCYEILMYAYLKKKPVFGICLGMQGMCIFSQLLEDATKLNKSILELKYEDFLELYKQMAEDHPVLTVMPENNVHFNYITYDNFEHAYHQVDFEPASFMASVYGTSKRVLCMHNVKANSCGSLLKVVGIAKDDNVMEAVESTDPNLYWHAVQFHPEFLDDDKLIAKWIEKVKEFLCQK